MDTNLHEFFDQWSESHDGVINPIKVEQAAADDPQHPVRPYLEWDDRVAAKAHRIWQVNELVESYDDE